MDIINKKEKVAVCSRSFSMNIVLRDELLSRYQNVTFNDEGIKVLYTTPFFVDIFE